MEAADPVAEEPGDRAGLAVVEEDLDPVEGVGGLRSMIPVSASQSGLASTMSSKSP
jgi:hypothetical protein